MEYYRRSIIAVGSNQSPPSIEEVDGCKYFHGGLICIQATIETKH